MGRAHPETYSKAQIILHWTVAALILFQIVFAEGIEEYGHALRDGQTPGTMDFILGNAHIWLGVTVLILMIARIALRFIHGAPPPAPAPKLQDLAAKVAHFLLYAALFIAPLSGIAMWFFGVREAGGPHHLMEKVIVVLVVLHIAGALWHHFVQKDNVLKRMLSSKTTSI